MVIKAIFRGEAHAGKLLACLFPWEKMHMYVSTTYLQNVNEITYEGNMYFLLSNVIFLLQSLCKCCFAEDIPVDLLLLPRAKE